MNLNIGDILLLEIMQELMVNCYFKGHFKTRVLEREEFKMKKTMILFVLGMIGIITTIY